MMTFRRVTDRSGEEPKASMLPVTLGGTLVIRQTDKNFALRHFVNWED